MVCQPIDTIILKNLIPTGQKIPKGKDEYILGFS